MAKLVGMSQSVDGYVDDAAGTLCMRAPPVVFHFLDILAGHAGAIYGPAHLRGDALLGCRSAGRQSAATWTRACAI